MRAMAEALDAYESDCCPGCGLHSSVLDDPEHHKFTFDERVCKVCAAQDQYGRIVAERDHSAAEKFEHMPARTRRPADGRHIYLRPLSFDEMFADSP